MKRVRSILFWTHLTAGVVCGVVILVMSFTGVVLALKPQILEWLERDVRTVVAQSTPRLGAGELLARVKAARPDAVPGSVAIDRDPAAAVSVGMGREGTLYVDPYSGRVLGEGAARANAFFQSMTSWHRYMGAAGEYRPLGRSATGASNLAFFLLGLSGLYLWWPRQLSWQHVKPVVWFRKTASGRARDFNWHNTIGFWCLPAILIMTLSGVVMSYPWANRLVYTLTGSPLPAERGGQNAAARGPAPAREGDTRVARQNQEAASARAGQGTPERSQAVARGGVRGEGGARPIAAADLDRFWQRAEQQLPTWDTISLRFPARDGGPLAFTITDGASWNRFARSQLSLDSRSGEILQWQPYDGGSLGQKLRGWLRFAHTGELGGLPGQIVAGLGCLGGVMLVWTGLSLAFRRLWNWSVWKRAPARERAATSPSSDGLADML